MFITPEIEYRLRQEESEERMQELQEQLLSVYSLRQAKLSDQDMRVRNKAREVRIDLLSHSGR